MYGFESSCWMLHSPDRKVYCMLYLGNAQPFISLGKSLGKSLGQSLRGRQSLRGSHSEDLLELEAVVLKNH